MSAFPEFFMEYLVPILVLVVIAIALTAYIFRRGRFDRGYRKGEAADPLEVRKENPPDEWSRNH